jgi:hypothetical protein
VLPVRLRHPNHHDRSRARTIRPAHPHTETKVSDGGAESAIRAFERPA